jgi:hypothetical protein
VGHRYRRLRHDLRTVEERRAVLLSPTPSGCIHRRRPGIVRSHLGTPGCQEARDATAKRPSIPTLFRGARDELDTAPPAEVSTRAVLSKRVTIMKRRARGNTLTGHRSQQSWKKLPTGSPRAAATLRFCGQSPRPKKR